MKLTADDIRQAIFGSSDGATGAVGLIGAFYVSGHRGAIALGCFSIAVAAGLSMAGGEYISDPDCSAHRAGVMGAATLFGGLLPAVPFFFGQGGWVLPVSAGLTLCLGGVITWVRSRARGWGRAAVEVYAVFVVVSAATVLIGAVQ